MNTARALSLVIAIVVLAIVVYVIASRPSVGNRPGTPSPHAIDQSQ